MNSVIEQSPERSLLQKFLGEWKNEKYVVWTLAIICMGMAFFKNDGLIESLSSSLFQTGLLFVCAGYLSELRYALIPESRNN